MSVFRKLIFTDLYINGHLVTLASEGQINECEVYQLCGRLVKMFPIRFLIPTHQSIANDSH